MKNPIRTIAHRATFLAVLVCFAPRPVIAQDAEAPEFEIENAVLDTSILFVVGAQEAVQELRGAFGWPTFQEGLAEGIYYRFDPDGYARFAPTARLDTDVFEVTCRSRTVTCQANKGILDIIPTKTGQFQLNIADYVEGEQFYLIEGTTEIQLPAQIMKPLDARLETLLSSNGELVVRRGADERARVSLAGFGQTVAYLRWVSARQDYTVLPQGWPIPNGAVAASPRLTAPEAWNNPMAQGQIESAAQPSAAVDLAADTDVDALRREVEMLRSLISQSAAAPALPQSAPAEAVAASTATIEPLVDADAARLAALEEMVAQLSEGLVIAPICGSDASPPCLPNDLAALAPSVAASLTNSSPEETMPSRPAVPVLPTFGAPAPESTFDVSPPTDNAVSVPLQPNAAPKTQTAQRDKAAQVEYLMNEIGLDAETALMVLQLGPLGLGSSARTAAGCSDTTLSVAFSDEMTRQALADLTEVMPGSRPSITTQPELNTFELGSTANTVGSTTEYIFLSDYLQSIFQPSTGK